jgi:MFS family permease
MARISQQVGVAGMFTCSIVNIQDQVPPHRRTEVIGSLGSSGFIGTVLGTNLGDLIFRLLPDGRAPFIATFGTTLVGGLLHTLLVLVLTRRECHISPPQSPNPWSLLWRHWPGPVVWVSLAMGTSFAITTVFLSRFASAAGLGGIAMFFLPYSLVAFACRWWMRDWGQRLGRHKMVLWGLTGLAAGQLLLLAVRSTAWLIPAGSACGFGHALLFPAVVSLGAGRFPSEYRGTGTTLVLGFQEIGLAIAAPLLGLLIDRGTLRQGMPDPSDGPGAGLLGYDLAFLVSAAVAVVSGVWYVLTAARHPDHDGQPLATIGHGPVVEAETDQGDLVVVSTE